MASKLSSSGYLNLEDCCASACCSLSPVHVTHEYQDTLVESCRTALIRQLASWPSVYGTAQLSQFHRKIKSLKCACDNSRTRVPAGIVSSMSACGTPSGVSGRTERGPLSEKGRSFLRQKGLLTSVERPVHHIINLRLHKFFLNLHQV